MTEASFGATGHLKWFDFTKGYGFVVIDQGDAMLHREVLRRDTRYYTICPEARVDCEVAREDGKLRVVRVLQVVTPDLAAARVKIEMLRKALEPFVGILAQYNEKTLPNRYLPPPDAPLDQSIIQFDVRGAWLLDAAAAMEAT